jgi:hypothetical protein
VSQSVVECVQMFQNVFFQCQHTYLHTYIHTIITLFPGTVNQGVSPDRVFAMGAALVFVASLGFYFIDDRIDPSASGSKQVNAFYCAVITLTT